MSRPQHGQPVKHNKVVYFVIIHKDIDSKFLRPFKFTVIEESSPFFSFKYLCPKYLIFGAVEFWGFRNPWAVVPNLGAGVPSTRAKFTLYGQIWSQNNRTIPVARSYPRNMRYMMAGLNITRCNTRNNNTDNMIIQYTEEIITNKLVISSKEL